MNEPANERPADRQGDILLCSHLVDFTGRSELSAADELTDITVRLMPNCVRQLVRAHWLVGAWPPRSSLGRPQNWPTARAVLAGWLAGRPHWRTRTTDPRRVTNFITSMIPLPPSRPGGSEGMKPGRQVGRTISTRHLLAPPVDCSVVYRRIMPRFSQQFRTGLDLEY